jgi:hypothetical protein
MSRKYHARAPETNSLKSALVQTVGINATKRSGTEKVARLFSIFRHRIYPMSHEDMLQLFDSERFLFDHEIPRDREAL